jgi:mRNA-capping enzyme
MHHFTLLDGEMIIDTMPDSQKQERRYLIYDMMAVNQVSVIEVRFTMIFMEINIISADKVIYCFVFILP